MGYAISPNYTLMVGGVLRQQLSMVAYGIIVNNLTNQWLLIEGAHEWVPPYVVGRQIPIQGAQQLSASFGTPVGFSQQASIPGQQAFIRATEQPVPDIPGISVAPASSRWAINHLPSTGVQASVTKAATPGVIHVADAFIMRMAAITAASGNVRFSVIDGVSGGVAYLITTFLMTEALIGSVDSDRGNSLGIKGTAGNGMTVEASAGIANNEEAVLLVGFDA